jgi:hypothetical protein
MELVIKEVVLDGEVGGKMQILVAVACSASKSSTAAAATLWVYFLPTCHDLCTYNALHFCISIAA